MKSKNFTLFSDCIPVKGFNRSIICDMMNNKYYFIPNGLYEVLEKYNGKTIETIKKDFDNQYNDVIDEYFDFLFENRLVFFNSNPESFPKTDLKWHSPSKITNAIIDFDQTKHNYIDLLSQFEDLKCSYIQMRFFKSVDLHFIKNIIQYINDVKSRIISIDFILPFNENFNFLELKQLLIENSRIHSIIIYNSPYNKSIEPERGKMGYLVQVEKNILSEKSCGIINYEYFHSNIKLYTESQHHNTCLNRKISIDKDGNIKNCPSMLQSFGNIKDTTLEEALNNPDFKKYWNVTKDSIEVCKDCEFRHICTDCRAYTERNHFDDEIDLSKPLKCGYNLYTNEWSEWSTNPLKEKAIEYYGMQDLVKTE